LHATLEGSYHGNKFKKELSKKTKLQKSTCPTCSRKNSGYFEAVLQFRCETPNISIDDSQIAKAEKVRGGVDYYLLSNNYARGLASQLSKKGYDLITSNKTFSRRDGQQIYRVFYSIKKSG
jgi:NMD protein affecting ribosome stability and mRNA decay